MMEVNGGAPEIEENQFLIWQWVVGLSNDMTFHENLKKPGIPHYSTVNQLTLI